MKIHVLLLFASALFGSFAHAFDVKLLANNKESFSRRLTDNDRMSLESWRIRHPLGKEELKKRSVWVLQKVMAEFTRREAWCDVGLPKLFEKFGVEAKILGHSAEYYVFIAHLRDADLIDDIFYKIIKDSADIKNLFEGMVFNQIPPRPFNLHTPKTAGIDLKKFYANYQGEWADDVQSCSIGRFYRLASQLKWQGPKDLSAQLLRLNWMAVKDGHISLETFNKLEILRTNEVISWPSTIDGYLDVLMKSKDKLAKTIETSSRPNFTENYISRKERLTRRGRLYKNFDSTQVMVLAQIIDKTARRMDAKYAAIHFRYNDPREVDDEIYVLSPMEQYRASVKMLRKDLGEIMRSESFNGTGVEYEDLIAAAYETGLLKSEELEYILKFEEFWNPQTPRWKAYSNFAFSIAGSATFYLPPPWNILGAMALVLTQSKMMGQVNPEAEDNWNVIL